MAVSSQVHKRYATALVEAAAKEGGGGAAVDRIAEELSRFARAVGEAPDLANVLGNPVFTAQDRERAIDPVLAKVGASDLVKRFLLLLSARDRTGGIQEVAAAVRSLADARAGRVRAEVKAAAPLGDDAAESLKRALEKKTGKAVALEVEIDPSLLGGVRARIGSTVLDGTLRSQLDALKERLIRG